MSKPTKEQIEEATARYRRAVAGLIENAPEGATIETVTDEFYKRITVEFLEVHNDALERAAKICDAESAVHNSNGQAHEENSPARDRCFARARAAGYCANNIRALKGKP